MKRVLFQGDSITDCGRGDGLGVGYPNLVAAELGYEFPNEYEFINRGISGNRVVDLLARWKSDCLNLKPDYISILIGVNDVWHELDFSNGVSTERYEKVYRMLLDDIKSVLPNTKVMLLAPYLTHGRRADENWEYFSTEVAKRREVVLKLAEEYGLPAVNLQETFDELCESTDPALWTAEGVHPTAAGHELIKRAWLECFEKIK